jgi:hypothetical protein
VAFADTLVEDYDTIDLVHLLVDYSVGLLEVDAAGIMLADHDAPTGSKASPCADTTVSAE